jgi:hypothetical protein
VIRKQPVSGKPRAIGCAGTSQQFFHRLDKLASTATVEISTLPSFKAESHE